MRMATPQLSINLKKQNGAHLYICSSGDCGRHARWKIFVPEEPLGPPNGDISHGFLIQKKTLHKKCQFYGCELIVTSYCVNQEFTQQLHKYLNSPPLSGNERARRGHR